MIDGENVTGRDAQDRDETAKTPEAEIGPQVREATRKVIPREKISGS